MKKRRLWFLAALSLLAGYCFLACVETGNAGDTPARKDRSLSVVTTIFPPYDFTRAVAGDRASIAMLLKPGAESHSYEPAPRDIIMIQKCDLFIYVGGESESWANRILAGMPAPDSRRVISLMDCVDTVEEEIAEGMETEEGDEAAYDEHVWTSPLNAKRIVEKIAAALCAADPAGAALYRENAAAYAGELDTLDAAFRAAAASAQRKTLVFGARFPFRYFTDAYGLDYYAAFPGCSTETEASAATAAFLINKVRAEKIPVVLYIEFSNSRMADVICEAAGTEKRLLHSAHNVGRDELSAGITYLEIMKRNVEVLKEALGTRRPSLFLLLPEK